MDLEVEVDVIGYLRPVFGAGTPKQDDKPSSRASSMGERRGSKIIFHPNN
jgi:hypothetical protein